MISQVRTDVPVYIVLLSVDSPANLLVSKKWMSLAESWLLDSEQKKPGQVPGQKLSRVSNFQGLKYPGTRQKSVERDLCGGAETEGSESQNGFDKSTSVLEGHLVPAMISSKGTADHLRVLKTRRSESR